MQMLALIQATISPFLLVATCCSAPKMGPFAVDSDIRGAEMALLLKDHSWMTQAELRCVDVCEWIVAHRQGNHPMAPLACEHSFVAAPESGPDAVVGHIMCHGEAASHICKGRRPLGHVEAAVVGEGLAGYLARCAHLEAASVIAFEELAGQLRGLGAPAELVARCVVAAGEERRHAVVLGGLAEAGGAVVPAVELRGGERSLRAIATHNAIEGCVHEAWAAVEAAWQGVHARDAELRAAMAAIAVEEARHAQLAWDLHAWLLAQLDEEGRVAVRSAQRAAISGLRAVVARDASPSELGMPDRATRGAMATAFAAGLVAAA